MTTQPSAQEPLRTFPLLVLLGMLLVGCSGDDPVAPNGPGTPGNGGSGGGPGGDTPVVLTTDQARFVEEETLVPAGGMVRWVSDSGLLHSITPVGHEEWEPVETNQKGWVMLEHEFFEPGTYEFRCDYHWEVGMVGRIVVHPSL